ncbi:septal ring lytic transglycosylase RlpA family protein [Amniculibacterium sp. G2-70]|uniref:septal ring lytic transglycosylase RlpA family protein n=2 Tax=Amniculibacterium TaxID=2715289 RepID=UPI003976AF7D
MLFNEVVFVGIDNRLILPSLKPQKFKSMMKGVSLVIIMMISMLSFYSFSSEATDAKTSLISFYHDKFNGRKTASGELFDNSKLTAAHRSLPFGTKLKMTNIKNGKSVVVRINDRGPFVASRALDVSKAAFKAIAPVGHGVVPVEYEVIN